MKYYYFYDKFKDDSLCSLIEVINENAGPITLFFSSVGGSCEIARMLLEILNTKKNITLVAGTICSSAFTVFYLAKCKKKLISGATGMFHYGTMKVEINDMNKVIHPEDKMSLTNNREYYQKESLLIAKKILTPKEMAKFNRGYDIFLPFSRMKQIFSDIPIV